jgi:hypothetical protein
MVRKRKKMKKPREGSFSKNLPPPPRGTLPGGRTANGTKPSKNNSALAARLDRNSSLSSAIKK